MNHSGIAVAMVRVAELRARPAVLALDRFPLPIVDGPNRRDQLARRDAERREAGAPQGNGDGRLMAIRYRRAMAWHWVVVAAAILLVGLLSL